MDNENKTNKNSVCVCVCNKRFSVTFSLVCLINHLEAIKASQWVAPYWKLDFDSVKLPGTPS